ncbi:hypothetical protein F2Q70_00040237 [Brassica cretica]|uniref:GCK domain-containing protein n=1 Tax=Brassica cretica TaxID=69181 RepID=A0A8S9K2X3_BRACR|nr:hypothetical protein F2Q70_00040237 [Brassica cretica]
MGIITSTFRKTENSETSGCSSWESVGSEYLAFMEKGGCIEPLLDYVDCKGEAEKKNEDAFTKCKKAKERLNKCVGAHREYHQPILKIMIPAVELVVNKIEALFPPEKLVDTVSTESADQPKEGDDPVYVFMNGGACTESYMALEDCIVKKTSKTQTLAETPKTQKYKTSKTAIPSSAQGVPDPSSDVRDPRAAPARDLFLVRDSIRQLASRSCPARGSTPLVVRFNNHLRLKGNSKPKNP